MSGFRHMRLWGWARLWLVMSLLIVAGGVCAHEVRPAYLEITENAATTDRGFRVLWKQPAIGELGVRLIPHLSGGALERAADASQLQGDAALRVWNVQSDRTPLEQQSLSIEGLDRTITDVFVKVSFADGRKLRRILRPTQQSMALGSGEQSGLQVPDYLALGIEHILTGFDHLLFVLGLVLLVRRIGTLIKTITAFTLAHSITLAATALNWIHPRPAVIETLVALSIALLAVELVKSYRGIPGLTARFPWAIAFVFGLLHGAAFAGALLDLGLPHGDVPMALFLFNIGVEVGQLLFIGVVLAMLEFLRRATAPRLAWRRVAWPKFVAPYAIGSLAAAWTLERLLAAFV